MEQILKTLQEIQFEAIRKGVSSFHLVTVRNDDGGYIILASVRLRDDDSDGDYLAETFFANTKSPDSDIDRIKAFINSL